MSNLTPVMSQIPADVMNQINSLVRNMGKMLGNLADRWQDEHQYEDIAEYAAVIKSKLPEGFTFVGMSKRPFGFSFTVNSFPTHKFAIRVRAHSIEVIG